MSDKVKFLMSFRARLMLLLTSFLLLTSILVLALDNWARKRVERVIVTQTEQITERSTTATATSRERRASAMQSLNSENFSMM